MLHTLCKPHTLCMSHTLCLTYALPLPLTLRLPCALCSPQQCLMQETAMSSVRGVGCGKLWI